MQCVVVERLVVFEQLQRTGRAKSAAMLFSLQDNLDRILQAWLLLAGLACAARIATAPLTAGGADTGTVAPYILLVLAPFVLACRSWHDWRWSWLCRPAWLLEPWTWLFRCWLRWPWLCWSWLR